MMKISAVTVIALSLLSTVLAQTQDGIGPAVTGSTTYNLTLTGAQNSPAVNDPTVGTANLLITFNTASNNITYQLTALNISEIKAAHIHVNAGPGANGSVGIPLYQAPFVSFPNATTTGLIAASALTPAVFVGPLEVLPDYNNVDVPTVLGQYIIPGLAYAQVHTTAYPDGAIRSQFSNDSIINGSAEAVYGTSLVNLEGVDVATIPVAFTDDVTITNSTGSANLG